MTFDFESVLSMLLESLTKLLIIVLIPLLYAKAEKWLANRKAATDKEVEKTALDAAIALVKESENTVVKCVQTVNNTFVDGLKAEGKFDEAAMQEAFRQSREAVMAQLSSDAMAAIVKINNDFDVWLKTRIEAAVTDEKKGKLTAVPALLSDTFELVGEATVEEVKEDEKPVVKATKTAKK